ncbi:MAG: hypothetical protein H6974_14050 [Gammaproteobacteria bacterium]|nr:hypothetical protein [Gammaproteobacteria bacterium]
MPNTPARRLSPLGRWLFPVLLVSGWAVTAPAQTGPPPRLPVLLSKETPVFQQFYRAFAPAAQRILSVPLERLDNITSVTASSGLPTIAVGTFACLDLLGQDSRRPVLCTLTPRLAIVDAMAAYRGPVTALYLDQPVERHLALIRQALPETQTLGFIAGPVSEREVVPLERATVALGWHFLPVNYREAQNLVTTLQPLLNQADVVLALPDPVVNSPYNIYPLLLTLYHKTIPVFGFSSAYVDAGALAAVFSTPEQIAQQTVELAATWLKQPERAVPPPEYPRYFTVRVNQGVAKSLQLTVPAEAGLQKQLQESREEAR